MNWASRMTNSAASWNNVATSHSALATGLLRVMHSSALATAIPANVQKSATVGDTGLFPLRVRGVPQRGHRMGLRAQPLEIVHEAIARVLGVLVVHAHVDRFLGADLLAVAAEDAAELVDLVDERVAIALLVLPRHQLDAVGGADLRAEPARDALGPSLLVGEHAVRPAPPGGDRPVLAAFFFGVRHRHLGPEQMAQRQRHPPQRGPHVRGLGRRSLEDLHADRHQALPFSSATEPAIRWPRSRTKNRGTASTTFKPNRASAKRAS